jgi:predicted nucleic acid-binding protein
MKARVCLEEMNCMSVRIFVDTNILVYSRDKTEPAKQSVAQSVLSELWREGKGRISTQVCNEYYVTVTRKIRHKLTEDEAWEDIEDLEAWNPIPIDMKCLRVGRHVQAGYGLSWRDSLIIAAASIGQCHTILSEDLNPGQKYLGITVENPFTSANPQ